MKTLPAIYMIYMLFILIYVIGENCNNNSHLKVNLKMA